MAMSCLNTAWSGDFKIVWEKPSFSAALVRRMPSSVPGGKQASLDQIYLGLCFLSLRVTKFTKIPLPPGLLNHDNWHHPPPHPSLLPQKPFLLCPPGKNNFYKAICCNPVNFPLWAEATHQYLLWGSLKDIPLQNTDSMMPRAEAAKPRAAFVSALFGSHYQYVCKIQFPWFVPLNFLAWFICVWKMSGATKYQKVKVVDGILHHFNCTSCCLRFT